MPCFFMQFIGESFIGADIKYLDSYFESNFLFVSPLKDVKLKII